MVSLKPLSKWAVSLLVLASCALSVRADSIAITSITPPSQTWIWPEATIGFKFTTSVDINVTALGVWDKNANGFTSSHQVGLFATGGALLTSTTVTSGSSLTNGFRYEGIASYFLSAGTYVIGAYFPDSFDEGAALSSITLSPEITYEQNLYLYGSGFVLPTDEWEGFDAGNIGPNFQYTVVAAPSVPDHASTAGLLGFGLISLLALKRRRNS